jgi:hypothetical protein
MKPFEWASLGAHGFFEIGNVDQGRAPSHPQAYFPFVSRAQPLNPSDIPNPARR